MEVYEKHIRSPDSDKAGSEEAVEGGELTEKESASLLSRGGANDWAVQPGLVPLQIFFVHIMHFLDGPRKKAMLLEKFRRTPHAQWPYICCGRFNSMGVGEILSLDTSTLGIRQKKPTMFLPDAGLGLFAPQTIEKGDVVWY